MTSPTATVPAELHRLTCQGKPLPRGARKERPWICSCGATFHGYDSAVKRDHKAHVQEVRA